MLPEYFPHQAFGAIADDRATEFLRRGNPQPRPAVGPRQDEHRHEPAMQPRAGFVHVLKLGTAANVAIPANSNRFTATHSSRIVAVPRTRALQVDPIVVKADEARSG